MAKKVKNKPPKSFGQNFVTKSGISKSQVSRGNDPILLKDFKEEQNKEEEGKEDIELSELLYGKGQGGKGRGFMQEVPLPKKKKEEEEPFKMGTTTAKASWKNGG